jgi:hypothetical protein
VTDEPIDLSDLSLEIAADESMLKNTLLLGTGGNVGKRILEGITNGTVTRGGLAEAGWHDIGPIVEDGLQLKKPGGS